MPPLVLRVSDRLETSVVLDVVSCQGVVDRLVEDMVVLGIIHMPGVATSPVSLPLYRVLFRNGARLVNLLHRMIGVNLGL